MLCLKEAEEESKTPFSNERQVYHLPQLKFLLCLTNFIQICIILVKSHQISSKKESNPIQKPKLSQNHPNRLPTTQLKSKQEKHFLN